MPQDEDQGEVGPEGALSTREGHLPGRGIYEGAASDT